MGIDIFVVAYRRIIHSTGAKYEIETGMKLKRDDGIIGN